jgi:hypothetical protein
LFNGCRSCSQQKANISVFAFDLGGIVGVLVCCRGPLVVFVVSTRWTRDCYWYYLVEVASAGMLGFQGSSVSSFWGFVVGNNIEVGKGVKS